MLSNKYMLLRVLVSFLVGTFPMALWATDIATGNSSPQAPQAPLGTFEKMQGTWRYKAGGCVDSQSPGSWKEQMGTLGVYIRKMIVTQDEVTFIQKIQNGGADCAKAVETNGKFKILSKEKDRVTLDFEASKYGTCKMITDKGTRNKRNEGDGGLGIGTKAEWFFEKDQLIRKATTESMAPLCPPGKNFWEVWERDPSS